MRVIVGWNYTHYPDRYGLLDYLMAFIVGLERLGHEVHVMEDVSPDRCLDEAYERVDFADWQGRRWFDTVVRACGAEGRSCLVYDRGRETHGLSFGDAVAVARDTDLLLNFGGKLSTPALLQEIDRRAYVDVNPGKTQVYYSEHGVDPGFDRHDTFFTPAANIGNGDCEIPTCGLRWETFQAPVLLEDWPVRDDDGSGSYTTITTWYGRHTFDFAGRFSTQKADQWWRLVDLPGLTDRTLEIALDASSPYSKDTDAFREAGWSIKDTGDFRSVEDYRDYIGSSRGELSAVHGPFVEYRVGLFLERSARYLASGRPVVLQSTGFEDHLPVGRGLLSFEDPEGAAAALADVEEDYEGHGRAARRLAEEHFDSDRVLASMLERAR